MDAKTLFQLNKSLFDVNTHVREIHERMTIDNKVEKGFFCKNLLDIIKLNTSETKDKEAIDKLLAYITLIIALNPDFDSISSLITETTPINLISSIISCFNLPDNVNSSIAPFESYLNDLIQNPIPNQVISFDSKTNYYSLISFVKILKSLLVNKSIRDLLYTLFKSYENITGSQTTISFLEFISDTILCVMEHCKANDFPNLKSIVLKTFTYLVTIEESPNSMIQYFMEPLVYFYENFTEKHERSAVNVIINTFAEAFCDMMFWKYPYSCMNYQDNLSTKLITIVSDQANRLIPIAYLLSVLYKSNESNPEALITIHSYVKLLIETNDIISITYLLSLAKDYIAVTNTRLSKIQGCAFKFNEIHDRVQVKHYLSKQHNPDKVIQLDYEIYTNLYIKEFNDKTKLEEYNREHISKFNHLYHKFMNMAEIISKILGPICEAINLHTENEGLVVSHFTSFYSVWVSCILSILHSRMHLCYYNGTNFYVDQMVELFSMVEIITKQLNQLPQFILSSITNDIGNVFFDHTIGARLTYDTVRFIKALNTNENTSRPLFSTIFSYTLKSLFNIVCKKRHLILSRYESDTMKWGLFFLFLMRILTYMRHHSPVTMIALLTYKKFLITSLYINLKKAANHQCIIKCIKHMQNLLLTVDDDQQSFGFKSSYLVDVLPDAQCELIFHAYNLISKDKSPAGFNQLYPLIDSALRSEKPDQVEEAAKLIIKIAISDPELGKQGMKPEISTLFRRLIQHSYMLSDETRLNLSRTIPSLASCILQPEPMIINNYWSIDGIHFNIPLLITDIFMHRDHSEETAYDIYNLIMFLFDYVIQLLEKGEKVDNKSLYSLIFHLFCLEVYQKLYQEIHTTIQALVNRFLKIYLERRCADFLFCMFQAVPASSSFVGKDITKSARYFVTEISKNVELNEITNLIDEMLIYFRPPEMNAALLIGLSIIACIVPKAFTVPQALVVIKVNEHARSLDTERSSIIEKTLEHFAQEFPYKAKIKFVHEVYDYLGRISCPSRITIISGLKKFEVPISIPSLDLMDSKADLMLILQQMTCALVCGITGKFVFSFVVQRLIQSIYAFREDQSLALEYLAARVFLLHALLSHPDIRPYFIEESALSRLLCSFLLKSLTTRWKMVTQMAKETLRLLEQKDLAHSAFARQVAEYSFTKESSIQFYTGQPERMILYMRISRFLSQNVTSKVFERFLQVYSDISKLPDVKLMQYLQNVDGILKFVSIRKFAERADMKQILLEKENGVDMVTKFIQASVTLLNHGEIPFKLMILDHILKFLVLFADVCIPFFEENPLAEEPAYMNLLTQICIFDKTGQWMKHFATKISVELDFPNKYLIFLHSVTVQPLVLIPRIFVDLIDNQIEFIETQSAQNKAFGYNVVDRLLVIAELKLRLISKKQEFDQIVKFVQIFENNVIRHSYIFTKFIEIFLIKAPVELSRNIGIHFCLNQGIEERNRHIFRYCLKFSHFTPDEIVNIFDEILEYKVEDEETFLHVLLYMLKHCEIDDDRRWLVSKIVVSHIASPLPILYIPALKIVNQLIKCNCVEKELLEKCIEVFFINTKLFISPAAKFIFPILKYAENHIDEVKDTFASYFTNFAVRRISTTNDMLFLMKILVKAPKLITLLPFNIIILLTKQCTTLSLQNDSSPSFICRFIELLDVGYDHITQEIRDNAMNEVFMIVCAMIEFLKPIENVGYILAKCILNHNIKVPIQVIEKIAIRTMNSGSLSILASALPNIEMSSFESVIEVYDSACVYLFDHENKVDEEMFEILQKHLLTMPDYCSRFQYIYFSHLGEYMRLLTSQRLSRFIFLLSTFTKFTPNLDHAELLTQILDEIFPVREPENAKFFRLFEFLVLSIKDVLPGSQHIYANRVCERVINGANAFTTMMSKLNVLMREPKLTMQTKQIICQALTLSNIEKFPDAETTLRAVEVLIEANTKYGLQLNHIIVSVLVLIIRNTSAHVRLRAIGYADKLLPKTIEERVKYFLEMCPHTVWMDDKISIVAIMSMVPVSKMWWHLQMFTDSTQSILDEVVAHIFAKLLKQGYISGVIDFLVMLIKEPQMRIATKAILYALAECKIKLDQEILIQALSITNALEVYPFIESSEKFDVRVVNFDPLADYELAKHMVNMPKEEISATMMTLMNQYKAAAMIFEQFGQKFFENGNTISYINEHFKLAIEQDMPLNDIILPLRSLQSPNDKIADAIFKIFESYATQQQKKTRMDVALVQRMIANTFKVKQLLGQPELERTISLEASSLIIAGALDNYKSFSLMDENFVRSINPVLCSVLFKLEHYISSTPSPTLPTIVDTEEPMIIVSSTMNSLFRTICGYTNRGLIAVSRDQLDVLIADMSAKMEQKQMSLNELSRFGPLSFQIFCLQPSQSLFSILFGIYLQLIESETTFFVKTEAVLRLITMIRLIIEDKSFKLEPADFVRRLENMKAIDPWQPYLQQLFSFSQYDWFVSAFLQLFRKYPIPSYCAAVATKQIEIANRLIQTCLRMNEVNSMNSIITNIECIAGIDTMMLIRQYSIMYFLVYIKEHPGIDVETEINTPGSDLYRLWNHIKVSDRECIDISKLSKLTEEHYDEFVEAITGNPNTYISDNMKLNNSIAMLNNTFPLSSADPFTHLIFSLMHRDVNPLGRGLLRVGVIVDNVQNASLLIWSASGIKYSIVASVMATCDNLFNQCYTSHKRAITLPHIPTVAFGEHAQAAIISGKTTTMMSLLLDHENDIVENLTVKKPVKEDILRNEFTNKFTLHDYLLVKRDCMASFSALSLVSYTFNLPYLNPGDLLITDSKFGISPTAFFQPPGGTPVRLSPNILNFLGPHFEGVFSISFSSCAYAMMSQFELTRALIEQLVFDEERNEDEGVLTLMYTRRLQIEEKLIQISPPTGISVEANDCIEWSTALNDLIEKSKTEDNQPITSIPWY